MISRSEIGAALHDRSAVRANELAAPPGHTLRATNVAAVSTLLGSRRGACWPRRWLGTRIIGHARRYGRARLDAPSKWGPIGPDATLFWCGLPAARVHERAGPAPQSASAKQQQTH